MPPSISLHMIVKNEEALLPRLLATVAPHVDDIVIVDTGSTDRTKEIAAAAGARVFDCTPQTHPQFFFVDDESTGAPPPYSGQLTLGNFGGARAFALAQTTGDYVLWLDADDELQGGEHLRRVVDQMEATKSHVAWFAYRYGFDDAGRCACELWRERLVKRGTMVWANPIHEVMIPADPATPTSSIKVGDIVVNHHRPPARSAVVAHRNYKVLLPHMRANPNDARTLFYFGNEARYTQPQQAIEAYERYVEISGWPEERCIARCYLGEIYEAHGQVGRAYACFSAATVDDPKMPDGWFALARLAYRRQDWAECVRLTEEGLRRGIPDSVIMVNPLSRSLAPLLWYNVALNAVGRVQDAHDACLRGLALAPEEQTMRHNLGRYRQFLDERAALGDTPHPLSPQAREGILLTMASSDPAAPPAPASPMLLEAAAMRMWKACIASGEPARALALLDALPLAIRDSGAAEAARVRTRAMRAALPDTASPFASLDECFDDEEFTAEVPSTQAQAQWDAPATDQRWAMRDVHAELAAHGFEPTDVRPTADGKLLVRARARRAHPGRGDVVIWAGPSLEPWSPLSPAAGGIGGSETACIEIARQLAALGYGVTVYNDCSGAEGIYDRVEYRHFSRFAGCRCDVFISSRQPQIADADIKARLMMLWVHDVGVGAADPNMHRWLLRFDRILCLSKWHKQFFLQQYPWVHESAVLVTRNGIDPARFAPIADVTAAAEAWPRIVAYTDPAGSTAWLPHRRNRLVFSSSPNRGLDALLDMWPAILAEVPDAELHVFYGFDSWERTAQLMGSGPELAQIAAYRARLASTPGVIWRGRIGQAALAREMMTAKVWAYPTAFAETYCVTAIEAQAAGCLAITTDLAALHETVRYGVRLSGSNADPAYRAAFVRECVAALKNEHVRAPAAELGREWALRQSWSTLGHEWDRMIEREIKRQADDRVPRYVQMLHQKAI